MFSMLFLFVTCCFTQCLILALCLLYTFLCQGCPFFPVPYLSKFYLSFYVSLNFCLFQEVIQMPSSQNLLLKVIAFNLSFHCCSSKSRCLLTNTFCLSVPQFDRIPLFPFFPALVQFMCFYVSQLCLIGLFCKI